MLQFIGKCLYSIIPNFYLNWKTSSTNVSKHLLYCEKLAIITFLLFLYASIIYIFVYENWRQCSNILDIIKNQKKENYNEKLFRRDNDFCNTSDGFFIIYLVFLLGLLLLNIVFGIVYNYYRKYKNNKTSKNKEDYNENIIVHIPIYNEDYDTIKSTIDSVCKLNYKKENILIVIVIDGIINQSNGETTDFVLLNNVLENEEYRYDYISDTIVNNINTIEYKDNRLRIYIGTYNEFAYSVIVKCGNSNETARMGNRGKKDSAVIIYETIYHTSQPIDTIGLEYRQIINCLQNAVYESKNIKNFDYMFILDCDTDAESNSLISLLKYLKTNNNSIAVCGETVVKNNSENFITIVQSFEYFISHLLLKTFEHIVYKVLVLSGCFTLFKLRADGNPVINLNIINKYTKESKGLFEKNLLELGEDRYLTILITQEYPDKHLSYIPDVKCYTNAPNNFKVLADQRRRWTNSLITCLILLCLKPPAQSVFRHIKMYILVIMELSIIFLLPLIIIIGLINSVVSIVVQGYSLLPVLITSIVILLNLLIAIAVLRFDMVLRFVPFFISLPVFSIYIPIFSVMNLDNLNWGFTRDTDNLDISQVEQITSSPFQNITPRSSIVNTPTDEIATMELEYVESRV